MQYQAFISYRHHAALPFSQRLAGALRRYARPIYKPPIKIFRDEDHLVPQPDLPALIHSALEDAKYLILLASKEAAESQWVQEELRIWCSVLERSENLIIVLTKDSITLDPGTRAVDWDQTDALPRVLAPYVKSIPLYVDLRWVTDERHLDLQNIDFKRAINAIAARLQSKDPNELMGEEVLQYRRNVLFRNTGVALISLSAIAAIAFGQYARVQRSIAEERLATAEGRRLGAEALSILAVDPALLPRSLLLGVEALRRVQSLDAERTLREGIRLYPRLVWRRYHENLQNEETRTRAVEFSPDGHRLLTAAWDSTARIWDVASGREIEKHEHNDKVLAATFIDGGTGILTVDYGREVRLWQNNTDRLILAGDERKRVAIAPGGKVVWWQSKTIGLIDPTRNITHTIEAPGAVRNIAFDPDGTHLAAQVDTYLIVWRLSDARPVFRQRVVGYQHIIALNKGASLVASTEREAFHVRVFDVARSHELGGMRHGHYVTTLQFIRDDKIVSSSLDGTVRVWDARTGVETARMTHKAGVDDVAVTDDGLRLISASRDRTARIWETMSGRETRRLPHETRTSDGTVRFLFQVDRVTFSPDGQLAATGTSDGTVTMWDIRPRTEREIVQEGAVSDLAFSPDGRLLAIGCDQGYGNFSCNHTVSRRDVNSTSEIERLFLGGTGTSRIRWNHDGRMLAVTVKHSALLEGPQRIVLLRDGESKGWRDLAVPGGTNDMEFSPDGKAFAVASGRLGDRARLDSSFPWEFPVVRIWSTTDDTEPRTLPHTAGVGHLAFSPNSALLLTGDSDSTAHLWNVVTGQEVWKLQHPGKVIGVAFSPSGRHFVTSSSDDSVRVFDTMTHHILFAFSGSGEVSFSPDGKKLAVAQGGRATKNSATSSFTPYSVRIWDLDTGALRAELVHERTISALAFTPDSRHIVSASLDGTARVWEIATAKELVRRVHDGPVWRLALSPDGKTLATAVDNTNKAYLWEWTPDALIREACSVLNRNLSAAEWSQYLPGEPYRKTCVTVGEGSSEAGPPQAPR